MVVTKLLLHCNGGDGSTSFPDASPNHHTVTAQADAQVDTAQKKFGTGSALFDGADDYLSIPNHADWDFGSGNLTVDFWFYPTAEARGALFASFTDYWFGLDYHSNTGEGAVRNVNLWASSNGTSWDLINADGGGNGIGSISLTLNAWNHVAVVRNGNNWMTFINGIKDVDITVSGSIINKAEVMCIGRWGYAINHFWLVGQIDEFRVSKGIAQWTANFTPPTSEYTITYILDIGAGSYSLGGQTMSPTAHWVVPITAGSYTLSGQAATLLKHSLISIEEGNYILTGQDINALIHRLIAISAGSYALSGQVVNLFKNSFINIEAGNYILTGKDIAALYNRLITANAGSYAITGQDTILGMVFILFLYSKLLDSLSKESAIKDSLSLTSKIMNSIVLISNRENK